MNTIFKGYLLIIGITSCVMGLWAMLGPNFVSWYPAFDGVERYTPLANFIRTMSGVFVASGYILIRFIFIFKSSIRYCSDLSVRIYASWKSMWFSI